MRAKIQLLPKSAKCFNLILPKSAISFYLILPKSAISFYLIFAEIRKMLHGFLMKCKYDFPIFFWVFPTLPSLGFFILFQQIIAKRQRENI